EQGAALRREECVLDGRAQVDVHRLRVRRTDEEPQELVEGAPLGTELLDRGLESEALASRVNALGRTIDRRTEALPPLRQAREDLTKRRADGLVLAEVRRERGESLGDPATTLLQTGDDPLQGLRADLGRPKQRLDVGHGRQAVAKHAHGIVHGLEAVELRWRKATPIVSVRRRLHLLPLLGEWSLRPTPRPTSKSPRRQEKPGALAMLSKALFYRVS